MNRKTNLRTEVDRLRHSLQTVEAANADKLLRDFAAGLAPEHAEILRDALGGAYESPDWWTCLSEDEQEWMIIRGLREETLATLLAMVARHAEPGHLAPFEDWRDNTHRKQHPPGLVKNEPWTPEYKALVGLRREIIEYREHEHRNGGNDGKSKTEG